MGTATTTDICNQINFVNKRNTFKVIKIQEKMKIIAILFLTAMVAIAKEKAVAEYLLVEVDSSEEKDIKSLTKELPDCVDQHPECCNGPLCTLPGVNLCTRCPKCPCHLCRLPVCKKTRKTPVIKKEGEECGYPPNGIICSPGKNYGICGDGLECEKILDHCFPGICKKKTTGKIDDKTPKPTPKSCCQHYKVPEFCLGLCMDQDETGARSVRTQRPNACSKHEFIIMKCIQS